MPTRRSVLAAGGGLALGGLLAGCGPADVGAPADGAAVLSARPAAEASGSFPAAGTRPLGLGAPREVLLHVPPGLSPGRPAALVVTLHGAGGDAAAGLHLLRQQADRVGLVLLAPASRGATWDAVQGGYGADTELLDRALARVLALGPVDPGRVAVAGFSDGASYALGVGLANGGLFRRVVAFSPGFVPPARPSGRPAVFVSHGVADDVLPLRRTSARIVPALRDAGHDVTYREFAGGHTVPPEIADEAARWLVPPG
ncbi:alpha/beta hydrolase [Geodermatophilus sp. SYSU D00079]